MVLFVFLAFSSTSCSSGTPTGVGPEMNSLQLLSVEPAFGATLAVDTTVDFRLRYSCTEETCFVFVFLLEETGLPISSSFTGNSLLNRGEGTIVFSSAATRPGTTSEVQLILHDSIFFVPFLDTPLFEARLDGRFTWR